MQCLERSTIFIFMYKTKSLCL